MPQGKVKWFSSEKAFGFIEQDNDNDIFVHVTGLADGVTAIDKDMLVEYEVEQGRKGPQAVGVKPIAAAAPAAEIVDVVETVDVIEAVDDDGDEVTVVVDDVKALDEDGDVVAEVVDITEIDADGDVVAEAVVVDEPDAE